MALDNLEYFFLGWFQLLDEVVGQFIDIQLIIGHSVRGDFPGADDGLVGAAVRTGRIDCGGLNAKQSSDVIGVEMIASQGKVRPSII